MQFPFPIATACAIFFTIWFIALFAVLPFGVRSQHETGDVVPGTDPGAPVALHFWSKIFWTTVLACVVFGIVVAIAHFEA
ncbi:DUF1467 family protein [Beijerinckia indica]|uniref:Uncharacterized protein n=1 Tax=Beijerinckia indica subsp. indica (strain ATCC 9039 / DSM 1715 / NCIMB 8712) TaxID=395963 RepID=B2IDH4_BEII9|nr:DUF1467 family protein [Beijerinckia indica]ACB95410.1 protein of unknown function DUF1467 [Beijerinckia indica subsp. indica ATCC 9039]